MMFSFRNIFGWARRALPGLAVLLAGGLAGLSAGCQSAGSKTVGSLHGALSALPSTIRESFTQDPAPGWVADDAAAWLVQADRYQAQTKDDSSTASLYTMATWTNFFVEADYIRSVTSVGAGGLVVRASPDFRGWMAGSGYLFALGSDGKVWQYAVFCQQDGKADYVKKWTASEAIRPDANNLAVLARDNLLQFYINGELVWSGRHKALGAGHAGLFGSTSPNQEAVHFFDEVTFKDLSGLQGDLDMTAAASRRAAGEGGRMAMHRDKSPQLRPGLLVRVTVLVSGKREIDAEVKRVSDNHLLDLPLIGPVSVQGLTLSELNSSLQVRYQDYFIEPQVLAEFVFEERPDAISPWGSVVVLGRVRTPGRVNIPPTQDLTVSGAIHQAGGLDTSAKTSAIRLTRRKPDGSAERVTIDFTAVGQRGSVENDLLLMPGDVIFVPESMF